MTEATLREVLAFLAWWAGVGALGGCLLGLLVSRAAVALDVPHVSRGVPRSRGCAMLPALRMTRPALPGAR